MNLLTTPIMYALLGAAVIAGGVATVQTVRLSDEKADHAKTKQDNADVLRNLAELTAKAAQDLRAREQQYARDSRQALTDHQKDKANALAKKDGVIDQLRSRVLKLRDIWTCSVPATSAGGARSIAGRDDDAADLRAAGAGDLVRIFADADGHVRWLQSELVATRKACGVTP